MGGESKKTPETIATPIHDPAALERAGWTNAEVIWEQIQEAAAECERSGEPAEAADLWQGALDLAREHLARGDLRLATSVANLAVAERRAGNPVAAARGHEEALALWDAGGEWVESLVPVARARSSTFHLRLESRHQGAYDRFPRERYRMLAREGRGDPRREARCPAGRIRPACPVAARTSPGLQRLAPAAGRSTPCRGAPRVGQAPTGPLALPSHDKCDMTTG